MGGRCRICTPVHLHTCTPTHPHTRTPAHLHTCAPTHLRTYTPARLRTCTRVPASLRCGVRVGVDVDMDWGRHGVVGGGGAGRGGYSD